MKKKRWKRPKLIVLVKNNQAENILSTCKNYPVSSGADKFNSGCLIAGCAEPCSEFSSS